MLLTVFETIWYFKKITILFGKYFKTVKKYKKILTKVFSFFIDVFLQKTTVNYAQEITFSKQVYLQSYRSL